MALVKRKEGSAPAVKGQGKGENTPPPGKTPGGGSLCRQFSGASGLAAYFCTVSAKKQNFSAADKARTTCPPVNRYPHWTRRRRCRLTRPWVPVFFRWDPRWRSAEIWERAVHFGIVLCKNQRTEDPIAETRPHGWFWLSSHSNHREVLLSDRAFLANRRFQWMRPALSSGFDENLSRTSYRYFPSTPASHSLRRACCRQKELKNREKGAKMVSGRCLVIHVSGRNCRNEKAMPVMDFTVDVMDGFFVCTASGVAEVAAVRELIDTLLSHRR
jgi:hypothetical protein